MPRKRPEPPSAEAEEDVSDVVLIEFLECEECRLTIKPEAIGYASANDVPHDMMCPRCGAPFAIATSWGDEEGASS